MSNNKHFSFAILNLYSCIYFCFKGNPNKPDLLRSCTALHYAASQGHVECLHLLVEAGGRWDATDRDGQTTLDVATGDCIPALRKLSKSKTCICYFNYWNQYEILVNLFIAYGCNVDIPQKLPLFMLKETEQFYSTL